MNVPVFFVNRAVEIENNITLRRKGQSGRHWIVQSKLLKRKIWLIQKSVTSTVSYKIRAYETIYQNTTNRM